MAAQKKTDAPLLPAYLVVGEDALKRDAVMKRLRARLSAMGDLSFNDDSFDGETAEGADIVGACDTVPFASPVRLVEVRAADKLKKADAERLVSYLGAPNGSTVLALVAEKLAKNARLYKAVAAHGKTAVIDCSLPKRYELPKMVRSMAVGHGVTLTEGAAAKIVELVAEYLKELKRRGLGVLLVEQKLTIALDISERCYVMGHGRMVFEGSPQALRADDYIRREWLEV